MIYDKPSLPVPPAAKYERLLAILRSCSPSAVAFSGGVDSTFLLKAAKDALDGNVTAMTAISAVFPGRERLEASAFCEKEQIRQLVFEAGVLAVDGFSQNSPQRCYLCKKALFEKMKTLAAQEGLRMVMEGSNADDEGDYRPGLQAIGRAA